MMTYSMYDLSVPYFTRGLRSLWHIVDTGAKHAASEGYEPNALLTARLYPNMLAFTRQVQIATDTAKRGCARLAGAEMPSTPDTETTFEELLARIEGSIAYLSEFSEADFADAATREFTINIGREIPFTGSIYLQNWALPNFFFHITTAYNLLRSNGVPLGKKDYLGALMDM